MTPEILQRNTVTHQINLLDGLHMCDVVEVVGERGVEVVHCGTGGCLEVKGRCQKGRLLLKVLHSPSGN